MHNVMSKGNGYIIVDVIKFQKHKNEEKVSLKCKRILINISLQMPLLF